MRVWPNDLDLFLHVNNGVYLTLCDLARVDLLLRSRTHGVATGRGRVFLIAGASVQLHRPLRLFQRFAIDTRVLGWDDRAFFVEHRFTVPARRGARAEDVAALILVEGRVFDGHAGLIRPADVLARMGVADASPELPPWVQRWRDDQRALRAGLRDPGRNSGPQRQSA